MEDKYMLIKYKKCYYQEAITKGLIKSNYLNKYLNRGAYSLLKFLHIYWTDLYLLYDKNNNIIVGSIAIRFKINPKSFQLVAWYYNGIISSEQRGRGLGKILFILANKVLNTRHTSVLLTVDNDNSRAISLYRGLDFKIIHKTATTCLMKLIFNN